MDLASIPGRRSQCQAGKCISTPDLDQCNIRDSTTYYGFRYTYLNVSDTHQFSQARLAISTIIPKYTPHITITTNQTTCAVYTYKFSQTRHIVHSLSPPPSLSLATSLPPPLSLSLFSLLSSLIMKLTVVF